MFKSNTGEAGGTENPDRIQITRLSEGEFDDIWFRIVWEGNGYEDCWINFRQADTADLDEHR